MAKKKSGSEKLKKVYLFEKSFFRRVNFGWKKLIGSVVVLAIFVIFWPVTERYSQSFKFADEDEHFAVGQLLDRGKRLYKDISLNHQPLIFITSQVVHRVFDPPNIFMLLKRHREVVFGWGLVWSLLFFWRFGFTALPAVVTYESIKYFVLGNSFLAESLAVYPSMYVFGSLVELVAAKKERREEFWLGLASAMAVFYLLPTALPLAMAALWRCFWLRFKRLWQYLLGAGVMVGGLLIFVNPGEYFIETIRNNSLYAVPAISEVKSVTDMIRLWTLPFTVWFKPFSLLNYWIAFISAGWFLTLVIFLLRKQWRQAAVIGGLFLLWGGFNARVLTPGKYFFEGFHLSVWLGVGVLSGWLLLMHTVQRLSGRLKALVVVMIAVLFGWGQVQRDMPLFNKIDPMTENYINYSPMATVSRIIRILSQSNDRLMSLPNETIDHWDTRLLPAMSQIGFNDWQYSVPERTKEYYDTVTNQPPAFIVFANDGSRYGESMEKLITQRYMLLYVVYRNTASPIRLYVRLDKVLTTTRDQWREVADLPIELEPKVYQKATEVGNAE